MAIGFTEASYIVAVTAIATSFILARTLSTARKSAADQVDGLKSRIDTLKAQLDNLGAEYTTVVEQCGVGVLVLDVAGVIVHANSKAAEWFHSSITSLIGRTLLEVTLSSDLERLFADARTSGCQQREIRVHGHNSESDLLVTVAPVDAHEKRYVLIAVNVTQLRHLETVRRDFVANVSHELRTPLTSIRAVAETLQQGALQDRLVVDRFLNMIIAESERLTRISDDLLVLSAAESRPPAKQNLDLSSLISVSVNRFQRQAAKAGIALDSSVSAEVMVEASHDQMEQVIVNLVDNAIKYTQEGGRVMVSAENVADYVYIHVRDTGIGIMQQDLPRIFERFYRVDKARSRETGGTGLGLSIVKHIVEAHGGTVSVESELNRGTVFTIMLPKSGSHLRSDAGIVSE